MAALRGGFGGVEMDMQAGVALAGQLGVPASAAMMLLREFAAGMAAGIGKRNGKGMG